MSILLTGGSGLLGRELQKLGEFYAPGKNILDVTRHIYFQEKPSLIVHAAAYTDVNKAELEIETCYRVNVIGTENLAGLGIPMLYISTDSVFDGRTGNYREEDIPYPQNFYSFSKVLGELQALRHGHKVIRTSFKERPWKSEYAFYDQFSSADYVDVIAPMIMEAINNYDSLKAITHIGTSRKSSYDIAVQTSPNVKKMSIMDIHGVKRPMDTSLDCSLWREVCV